MFYGLGTPLFENNGYAIHELYTKAAHQTFSQWGYMVVCPDESYSVFTDKVSALQHLNQSLHRESDADNQVSAAERILQEDMTSSPSTSSLITTD
mgnify:CR=1 FL=1